MTPCRFFAIVPAAGHSRRMGRPKLLLPWHGNSILERVLSAWNQSRVTRTLVVVRQDDAALRAICDAHDVDCICPAMPPRDMKQSVQCALEVIADRYQPADCDAWLLAPADMPNLTSELVDAVIRKHRADGTVIVPRCGSRTGHPVLFPWSTWQAVFQLAENEGVNRLVSNQTETGNVEHVDWPASAAFDDIDTAEDFERQ